MEEITKGIVDKYGDKQIVIAIEELSELTKELCKAIRGQSNNQNVLEELADCYIVLKEMQLYFGITPEQLDNQINAKLQRTKTRYLDDDIEETKILEELYKLGWYVAINNNQSICFHRKCSSERINILIDEKACAIFEHQTCCPYYVDFETYRLLAKLFVLIERKGKL